MVITEIYVAPQVEIIEVEVEKGFAMSGYGIAPDSNDTEFGYYDTRSLNW